MTSVKKTTLRDPQLPEGMTFIQDRAEIFNLLVHSSTTECEAQLSFKSSPQKFAGSLQELPRYSDKLRVDLGTAEQAQAFQVAQDTAQGTGRSECLVMIYSKRQYIIGLHCRLASIEGTTVIFEFPERAFKLQRRKTLRWVLAGAYEVEIGMEFPDVTQEKGFRLIQHRVTDVSPGGVSFYLADRESGELFPTGLELKNLTFVLQGQRYQGNGVVRGVLPLPRNFHLKGYRVGVEFVGLDELYEERLERYVLTQSAYSMI